MAQTVRTIAEILALFADGQAAGAITPQDVRDALATIYGSSDDEPVWKDLLGSIVVRGSGANDPTWSLITGSTAMYAYQFSATVMQQFWTALHIPHDYSAGTAAYLHMHWMNAAAAPNTGTVRWGFEYMVAKGHNQQAFPAGATTTVYVNQASPATRYQHNIAELALADAVPSTDLEPDSIIYVRAFRDAANGADTCTDAVFALMCDLHYQADSIGTKNKSPNFDT